MIYITGDCHQNFERFNEAFVKEAKRVVIGSPSYAAAMTPALHAWLLETGCVTGFGQFVVGISKSFSTLAFKYGTSS